MVVGVSARSFISKENVRSVLHNLGELDLPNFSHILTLYIVICRLSVAIRVENRER